jgi:hypothetical protein
MNVIRRNCEDSVLNNEGYDGNSEEDSTTMEDMAPNKKTE